MKRETITQVKETLSRRDVDPEWLKALREDERSGVQKLLKQYDQRMAKLEEAKLNYQRMLSYETKAEGKGYRFIAGVDEVGRGPLAGPVVAAAVILGNDIELIGINDSKQLNEQKRESYYSQIMSQAKSVGVGIVDNKKLIR